jgi:hypothetical protein
MDENNLTNEVAVEETEETLDGSGKLAMGFAMAVASALTLAAVAGGKKLKTVWKKHKDKKAEPEIVEPGEEDWLDDENVVTVEPENEEK